MNTTPLYSTPDVARRAAESDMAYWALRLEALRGLPGNPYGAQLRRFGQTIALMTAGTSNHDSNRVSFAGHDDLVHLDEIIAWYTEHGVNCRFDVIPPLAQSAQLRRLVERGFYQSGFKSVLFGAPQTLVSSPFKVVVRSASPAERDLLTETYLDGFEIPAGIAARTFMGESLRPLVGHPSLHFFFALIDNAIAGMAVLYIYKCVGYLAGASTLSAFRDRGCQKALLQARFNIAAEQGCNLVIGNAAINSISQQNMEKMGLRIAYTRVLWTR